MATLPMRHAAQYQRLDCDPQNGPNASNAYVAGPPAIGLRLASRANSNASASAPIDPITQPSTVRLPTEASVAGSRKTPDPIMLPATTIVARTGPSLRWPVTYNQLRVAEARDQPAAGGAASALCGMRPRMRLPKLRNATSPAASGPTR